MITAGNKIARAKGIRFVKSQKGTMGLEVAFEFEENGAPARMNWTGWLTDTSIKNTLRTLVEVLDYSGDETVVDVPEGDARTGMLANQDAINRQKQVELVVEHEEYEGKQRARIKWVNNVGGGQFAGVAPQEVRSQLGAIGFKAHFLSAKQQAGQPRPKSSSAPANHTTTQQGQLSMGDIPF